MAITITKHPPILILSKQPVSFEIQSDESETPLRLAGRVIDLTGDSIQADSNKKAVFELSDYLQGLITERGQTSATPVIYTDLPKEVTFGFNELAGDPVVAGTEEVTGTYYLLDGAMPTSRRKTVYANWSTLFAWLQTSNVLSWWPYGESKRILPTQKEFINFLQEYNGSPITLTLYLRLFFTDGTSVNIGTIFTVTNVAYMKLVYFPTGYADLGIAAIMSGAYPTKTLDKYNVTVKTETTAISTEMNYVVDFNYYQNPRTLWIRNAYGMWEVLLCTGLGAQENAVKPETAVTDGQSLPDKLTWKVEKSDVVKVNTGFLSAAQLQWLSDMDFTEAYEMIGSVMHPIVFHDLSLPVVHDGEYQYSAELEYEYAYNETTEQG